MNVLIAAALFLALLPPPVPPEHEPIPNQKPGPPPSQAPSPSPSENKESTPDPAYMTLLPDDGSPWGLPSELSGRLAAVAEKYLEYAVKFSCTETVRKARFEDGEAKSETSHNYGYLL